jgi:cell division protein FtsW (lipid II flippase)
MSTIDPTIDHPAQNSSAASPSVRKYIGAMLLLAATAIVLVVLAGPLIQHGLDLGLGNRYAHPGPDHVEQFWSRATDSSRAASINAHLPYIFVAWAFLGWIGLQAVGRWREEARGFFGAIAMACLAASSAGIYGVREEIWGGAALMAAILVVVSGGIRRLHTDSPDSPDARNERPTLSVAHSAWIWAGWTLLTGMGLLWLTDLAARGPVKLQHIGLRQLDALWLAGFVVMPMVLWAARPLTRFLLALRQAWHTPRGPWVLGAAALVLMGGIVWLGKYAGARGYPYISAELVRMLIALSLAWMLSRYVEWGAGKLRLMQAVRVLFVLIAGVFLTLVLTEDLGPALAICVSLIPVVLLIGVAALRNRRSMLIIICVLLAWVALLAFMQHVLVQWLPQQQWVPERLRLRVEAMLDPFSASLDYVSQIRWLWDAATGQGFGLGAVPWCGAKAHLGLAVCNGGSGVPVQFASDYTFSATAAVWGRWPAVGLVVLSLVYLLGISRVCMAVAGSARVGSTRAQQLLYGWIVTLFAALSIGQLVVSIAGNTQSIPLSGVTQPLLGLGTVSVLAIAAWIGYALSGLHERSAPASPASSVSPNPAQPEPSWLNRFALTSGIGGCLLVVALSYWALTDKHAARDRMIPDQVVRGLSVVACMRSGDSSDGASDGLDTLAHCTATATAPSDRSACSKTFDRFEAALRRWPQRRGALDARVVNSCQRAGWALAALRYLQQYRSDSAVNQLLDSRPDELPALIATRNPYRLEGCIFLKGDGPVPAVPAVQAQEPRSNALCPGGIPQIDAALPHAQVLGQTLGLNTSRLRDQAQSSDQFRFSPERPPAASLPAPWWARGLVLPEFVISKLSHVMRLQDTSFGRGPSIELNLSRQQQDLAQKVADCYTGKDCSKVPTPVGAEVMKEHARARMIGTLVIDAKTGAIEAAASAYTPCYEAQHSGHTLPSGCVQLPTPPAERSGMLTNRALNAYAMMGSTNKIPMALALMRVHSPLTRADGVFERALSHSDTEAFLDEVMCKDAGFDADCIRRRLEALAKAGHDLGWHSFCPKDQPSCHRIQLLGDARWPYTAPPAQWLTHPRATDLPLMAAFPPGSESFTSEAVLDCYAQGDQKRWRNCQGEGLVTTVADLFGQGNATTTPVGLGQGLLRLVQMAQAPSGSITPLSPSLTGKVTGARPMQVSAEDKLAARRVLKAMVLTTRPGGTANAA